MRVQGRVQGRVVAGRFWCSYACVSLTQTACARPRAACAPVCACVCRRVHACVCVPIGGGVRVLRGVVWFCVVVWRAAGCIPLFFPFTL